MIQKAFERTETGEPHARRRRELLARSPAIRALFGYDRRTARVTLGLVVAQLALAGPLNWITFNVGHHSEHHDFMNVPGWRLPALRRLAPEYRELISHRSWAGVLWHFITDRRLGYGSRIVRTRAAFDRGRAALAQKKPSRVGIVPAVPTHESVVSQ